MKFNTALKFSLLLVWRRGDTNKEFPIEVKYASKSRQEERKNREGILNINGSV